MRYTINILKESKAAFIMELLSSFDFIQVEAEAKNVHDWWDDLTDEEKNDLKESLVQGERGEEKPLEEVFKKYGL
jgi:hypothetical protein